MSLVTELADRVVLLFGLHQKFALLEGVGERLFNINRYTSPYGIHRCREVREIGSTDEHRIDFTLHRIEHPAEVFKARHIRVGRQGFLGMLRAEIDIAKRGDNGVTGLHEFDNIVPSLISYADTC